MSRFWADLERVDCVADDICERYWDDPDPDVRHYIRSCFANAVEHALARLADERGCRVGTPNDDPSSTPSESAGPDHSIHADGPRMDA